MDGTAVPDGRRGREREAVAEAVGVSVQPRREDYWGAGPWPSKPNRADHADDDEEPSTDASLPEGKGCIPLIVEKLRDEFPALARMAISMESGRRMRRECTREIRGNSDGSLKSRIVTGVLKEFLRWFYDIEESKLHLKSNKGRELAVDLTNTYNEDKAKEYYGRLKDIERELHREGNDPHTAMLTFSASSTNDDGMLRPPADHLRELQETWGDNTRRELQRQMTDAGFDRYDEHVDYELANGIGLVLCGAPGEPAPMKWWEYVTVVEPHGSSGGVASGYGHFHTAIFASDPINTSLLAPVIGKHVEKCDHAEPEAHGCYGLDPSNQAISINRMTNEDNEDAENEDGLGNLGSYLSEYIGGFSGPPNEREVYQLVFESVCWSTGTQRVRFSNGANQLARQGRARRTDPSAVTDEEWTATAIENGDGEKFPIAQKGGQDWMVEILNGPPIHREAPGERDRSDPAPGEKHPC